MKLLLSATHLLVVTLAVSACSEGHRHTHDDRQHERRAAIAASLTPPLRPLEWGDVNFIHTTDTHGWLLGHQKKSFPEPNYSGNLGDFWSFVSHMKQKAHRRGVDLLLVDTGDLHDGTGLVDGFPLGGVEGHDTIKFFTQMPYDVLAIGNHELYVYANALDMYKNFAPHYNGRYLTSNVNITVPDANGKPVSVPIGSRFAKFKTHKGRRVTAFGVLFDFTGNAHNTTVQPVAEMVKEPWFLDAIAEEPDFFLLAGHMPIAQDNWPVVFNAIRAIHRLTPMFVFGGHTHIRDCVQLDKRSMSLESGRYMETVGWLSAKLRKAVKTGDRGKNNDIKFSRRYLDPNRVTYEFHTGRHGHSFDTKPGRFIAGGLKSLAKKFNLDFLFGTAPHDFFLNNAPYPSENSLISLYIEKATPTALAINNTRASIPHWIIVNSGAARFDVFQGTFTRNDQLTAFPFSDAFQFIENVPAGIAKQVLPMMNGAGAPSRRSTEEELYALGHVEHRYRAWLKEMNQGDGEEKRAAANLTLGYVTKDACPGIGDDIPHAPLPFFAFPDFVASPFPDVHDDTPIDLVFFDFIASQVVQTLNSVQKDKTYSLTDVKLYSSVLASQVLGIYAQSAWK